VVSESVDRNNLPSKIRDPITEGVCNGELSTHMVFHSKDVTLDSYENAP
jgi:hypothetical protein